MWSWRLWPWHRVHQLWLRLRPAPTAAAGQKQWWWFPNWTRQSNAPESERASTLKERVHLVVVHAGGAVLRANAHLSSPKVGTLRRGEVVTQLKEDHGGKRAYVRTPEGGRAWISTVTQDNEPIVRRITEATGYKATDMPLEGTSNFADEFERRWQEKWQRLRVDADRVESRPKSIRGSSLGVPIRAWRPSAKLKAREKPTLRPRFRNRPTPPAPVPKLEQPTSGRITTELLPQLDPQGPSGNEEDLPDLISFDTWPRFGRDGNSNSRVPPLAELLGGRATTEWPKPQTEGSTSLYGGIDDDDLPKEALVFNTEPAVPPSRSHVSAAPPTRGFILSTERLQRDPKTDTFDYLLKDIEGGSDALETEDSMALAADQPVCSEEATTDEMFLGLASFSDAYDKEDEEKQIAESFQFDPIPRSWAKRSSRKVLPRFPRYAKQELQASLDVEQFLEGPSTAEQIRETALAEDIAEIKSGLDSLVAAGAETTSIIVNDADEHVATTGFSSTLPQENIDSHVPAANDGHQRVPPPTQVDESMYANLDRVPPCEVVRESSAKLVIASAAVEAHVDDIPDLSLNPFFDANHKSKISVSQSQEHS